MAVVQFDRDLIERYSQSGPRYTSYPTAAEFRPSFTEGDLQAALERSNAQDRPLSLYTHIPFCQQLCYYCGCNKIVTRRVEKFDPYVDALLTEAGQFSGRLTSRPLKQLHFGGGTPSYLTRDQLERLMAGLREHFCFADDAELGMEVDPRTVDAAGIKHIASVGFNRLSLGIQDFDPAVQHAINRIQPLEDVRDLTDAVRAQGIDSLSFDLIYGLPLQTLGGFGATLDRMEELRPDRIALYNYAHLPERFKSQRLIRDDDLPSPATRLNLLETAITRLTEAGYVYIGMDHFALPEDPLARALADGSLRRNFQGYSTHAQCDLVALGTSAISHIGDAFAQNATSLTDYRRAINAGGFATVRGISCSRDDRIRADAIESIMCQSVLDLKALGKRWGIDARAWFASEWQQLAPLVNDGLVELEPDRLQVTLRGRLLVRIVAMVFDAYRSCDQRPQFSKVV